MYKVISFNPIPKTETYTSEKYCIFSYDFEHRFSGTAAKSGRVAQGEVQTVNQQDTLSVSYPDPPRPSGCIPVTW